jgi:hypothetical protein
VPYYHVTLDDFPIGRVIDPGAHGKTHRQFNTGGGTFPSSQIVSHFWELSLEAARSAMCPDQPSRLSCVFATETLRDAQEFRRRCRAGAKILVVEPTIPNVIVYRGDFSIISDAKFEKGDAFIDFIPAAASRYWKDGPVGLVEVLIPCPVRVMSVVSENV